jgi:hypothetical protein
MHFLYFLRGFRNQLIKMKYITVRLHSELHSARHVGRIFCVQLVTRRLCRLRTLALIAKVKNEICMNLAC